MFSPLRSAVIPKPGPVLEVFAGTAICEESGDWTLPTDFSFYTSTHILLEGGVLEDPPLLRLYEGTLGPPIPLILALIFNTIRSKLRGWLEG